MKCGMWAGLSLTLILYAGIHVFIGNIMLAAVAFVCGLFWACMYPKYNFMLINVISHTVWDVVVFLALPFS